MGKREIAIAALLLAACGGTDGVGRSDPWDAGAPSTGGQAPASGGSGGDFVGTGGTESGGAGGAAHADGGATGGVPSSGGAWATGGYASTGGYVSTGGWPATGGTVSTGGAPSSGGLPGTGGAIATGGFPGSGGATTFPECSATCVRGYCPGGVCVSCPVGQIDCDHNPANECETFVSNSNCGSCGFQCLPGLSCQLDQALGYHRCL